MTYSLKKIVESHKFNKSAGECIVKLAQYVSAVLAADKGIASEIRKINNNKIIVVAQDGKGIELCY